MNSKAGEAWGDTYRAGLITWVTPDLVDLDYIEHLSAGDVARSLWTLSGSREVPGKPLTVLEAGCGIGLYGMACALLGHRVTAVDYNDMAIDAARRIQTRIGKPVAGVKFETGNLLKLDFPDGSFDFTFNQAVLEYFCDDNEYQQALKEIVRVTKPGGAIALVLQNTASPLIHIKKKLGYQGFINQPAVRAASARDILKDLQRLNIVNLEYDGIDPWKGIFHGIPILTKPKASHDVTYLVHRFLKRVVPLPRKLRANMAMQFVVSGNRR